MTWKFFLTFISFLLSYSRCDGQKTKVPRAEIAQEGRLFKCKLNNILSSFSNVLQWKQDANLREIKVMRRYHIQDREDYHKQALTVLYRHSLIFSYRYNKLCGSLRSFAHRISLLPAKDPYRPRMEAQLLAKLYDMGVLNSTAKLSDVDKLTVAAFCRRRLAVVMCMSKMAETVSSVRLPNNPFSALLIP